MGTKVGIRQMPELRTYPALWEKMKEYKIPSSTFPEELKWLWHQTTGAIYASPSHAIVECGTLNGASALVIASAIDNVRDRMMRDRSIELKTHLWTVDNYAEYEKHKERNDRIHSYRDNVDMIREFGYEELVTVVHGDDIDFLATLDPRSLSMLWIDSWHNEHHVRKTLDIGLPLVVRHGSICGHDYDQLNYRVVYAVDDWKAENGKYLSGFGTYWRSWWTIVRHPMEVG